LPATDVLAQSSAPSSERFDEELRGIQERRQQLQEELRRIQSRSQSPTSTPEEDKAARTGTAVSHPASERPSPRANASHLLGTLAESEREKVKQADVLRLASRGEDFIPQDSPVLAQIAEQAGISVAEWFARLPASEVSEQIRAEWTEPGQKPPVSTPVRAPGPTSPSEQEQPPERAPPSETASRLPSAVTTAPVPSAPSSVGPPPAEVDGLLKHGKELFATGDIAGARALFLRAAAGHDPAALTALAQTYDPQVLGTMRVRGTKPDPSKAKTLYDQAEAARKRR